MINFYIVPAHLLDPGDVILRGKANDKMDLFHIEEILENGASEELPETAESYTLIGNFDEINLRAITRVYRLHWETEEEEIFVNSLKALLNLQAMKAFNDDMIGGEDD